MAELTVEICGRTDAGLIRDANEDHLAVANLDSGQLIEVAESACLDVERRGLLMIVCDGMGGVRGGEVAASMAADVIYREMKSAQPTEETAVYARLLRRAIRVANQTVRDAGDENPERRGMGTTVSAAGIVGDILVLAQVGDSRAYVQRGGSLVQVTRDQSLVSALLSAGRMTEAEARQSDKRSMILQALGTAQDVVVAMSVVELRQNDRVLLCSDGLHGAIADEVIRATMTAEDNVRSAVGALIDRAKQAGGPDNITVLVASFTGDGLRSPMSTGDVPLFTEFDPMEEGDRALTHTSRVARRLARRAGLRSETFPPSIPATGQHPITWDTEEGGTAVRVGRGPAYEVLARGERIGATVWALAVLALIGLGLWLLWGQA
jgi:protein phosphatase